eukprot:1909564-Pleurochrysis_carterae.AAC.2
MAGLWRLLVPNPKFSRRLRPWSEPLFVSRRTVTRSTPSVSSSSPSLNSPRACSPALKCQGPQRTTKHSPHGHAHPRGSRRPKDAATT